MDDFTVYGSSFDACLDSLSRVLDRCIETNLVLNIEKCHFMVHEGIVSGHLVSSRGIEVNKTNIDAITSIPYPASVCHTLISSGDNFLSVCDLRLTNSKCLTPIIVESVKF